MGRRSRICGVRDSLAARLSLLGSRIGALAQTIDMRVNCGAERMRGWESEMWTSVYDDVWVAQHERVIRVQKTLAVGPSAILPLVAPESVCAGIQREHSAGETTRCIEIDARYPCIGVRTGGWGC